MAAILNSSCRLCLKEPPLDALVFSVFDTYQGSVLADLIDQLFSVKVTKSDRLLTICLDCVNRINTVRLIQNLFFENNRKLQDWLQIATASTSPGKDVSPGMDVYEVYEITMPSNPATQLEVDKIVLSKDEHLEDMAETLQDEPMKEPRTDRSETSFKKVMTLDIEEAFEVECDALASSESDTENSSVNRTQGVQDKSMKTEDAPLPKNKCYLCGRIFQNAVEFTQHLPEHFTLMPYTCIECGGLEFKTVLLASRHIGMHDVHDRPFQCRLCPLRFATRSNSLTHERKMHRFKLKRKLAAEQNSKPTQKPRQQVKLPPSTMNGATDRPNVLQCEMCSKTFTRKKNLTRHLMVHTGETPFKCSQCNRSFRQAGELKSHHAVHESRDSYQCELCNTTYRNFSMLAKHRKAIHSSTSSRRRRPIAAQALDKT